MVLAMKVTIKKEKNTVKEPTPGVMAQSMWDNGWKTRLVELELTLGLMVEDMMENGSITTCMAKVPIHGRMGESTKVNTSLIRNTDLAFIPGLMEEVNLFIIYLNRVRRTMGLWKIEWKGKILFTRWNRKDRCLGRW